MELIGNLVLQFFGYVVLPVLLPIFIFSILVGARNPERLISEAIELSFSILACLLGLVISIVKTLFKIMQQALRGKSSKSQNKSVYGNMFASKQKSKTLF